MRLDYKKALHCICGSDVKIYDSSDFEQEQFIDAILELAAGSRNIGLIVYIKIFS